MNIDLPLLYDEDRDENPDVPYHRLLNDDEISVILSALTNGGDEIPLVTERMYADPEDGVEYLDVWFGDATIASIHTGGDSDAHVFAEEYVRALRYAGVAIHQLRDRVEEQRKQMAALLSSRDIKADEGLSAMILMLHSMNTEVMDAHVARTRDSLNGLVMHLGTVRQAQKLIGKYVDKATTSPGTDDFVEGVKLGERVSSQELQDFVTLADDVIFREPDDPPPTDEQMTLMTQAYIALRRSLAHG